MKRWDARAWVSRSEILFASAACAWLVLAAGGCCTPSDGTGDPNSSDPPIVDPNGSVVADHRVTAAFDSIPDSVIATIQSDYRIFYGHTSHGSQIITGMEMIQSEDARYAFNSGAGSLSIQEQDGDLGENGDTAWADTTRAELDPPGSTINVVMWSWCGGVSTNSEDGIDIYLNTMNQLESEYPNVVFVYMTGHLDGTGPGEALHTYNDRIREYCRNYGKILFDFADIESYDPAGNYYPYGSDACEWCTTWCLTHSCPTCVECAHSQCMNCFQKGKAFWWMMARISGWTGS